MALLSEITQALDQAQRDGIRCEHIYMTREDADRLRREAGIDYLAMHGRRVSEIEFIVQIAGVPVGLLEVIEWRHTFDGGGSATFEWTSP